MSYAEVEPVCTCDPDYWCGCVMLKCGCLKGTHTEPYECFQPIEPVPNTEKSL